MSKHFKFSDGSAIEWVDKESLKYLENCFQIVVWVDFESGFFSQGRVIKASSITHWNISPIGCSDVVDNDKRDEILNKLEHYYRFFNTKIRIEL